MAQSPSSMTLREKLSHADKLVRELIEHLDHGFIPKAHQLRRITRHRPDSSDEEVTDLTIRGQADLLLEADEFSRRVAAQLDVTLQAIDDDINRVAGK